MKGETSNIVHNRARCRKCGDVIESTHVHDFKYCSCGSIFVDGGQEYIRRGGNFEDIESLDEYSDIPVKVENPRRVWL